MKLDEKKKDIKTMATAEIVQYITSVLQILIYV